MTHNFLDQIRNTKQKEVATKKQRVSLSFLKKRAVPTRNKTRDFISAITCMYRGNVGLIAEIKLASPSWGNLGERSEAIQRVKNYQEAGADAISVVVDKTYFNGDMDLLSEVKEISSLSVLCKDFIIDEYQIYEAKFHGADAVLLIASLLNTRELKTFVKLIVSLGIEPVVELSEKNELKKVMESGAKIISVNARNFSDFSVDVDRACRLLKMIPDTFVKIGFSGVKSSEDVVKYKNAEAKAVLVGTSLMRANNVLQLIHKLKGL